MAKSKKQNTKNGENNLINQSEFARLVGASRQLIFKLIKDGTSKRIHTVKKSGVVLIDKEKSLKLWYENKDVDKDIGRTFASVINEAKNNSENKNKDKKENNKNKYLKKRESKTNSKNKEDYKYNDRENSEKDLTVKELVRLKILADVQKKANKNTGDTKGVKYFSGGFIQIGGLQSISKLKAFSIKTLIITEADESKSDLGGQGTLCLWQRDGLMHFQP